MRQESVHWTFDIRAVINPKQSDDASTNERLHLYHIAIGKHFEAQGLFHQRALVQRLASNFYRVRGPCWFSYAKQSTELIHTFPVGNMAQWIQPLHSTVCHVTTFNRCIYVYEAFIVKQP